MEKFILDAVIEGVPSPRSGKISEVWPKALEDQWKPREVAFLGGNEDDVRRVWRLRDPESDLDVTVIWVPGPGDPEEPRSLEADDDDESAIPTGDPELDATDDASDDEATSDDVTSGDDDARSGDAPTGDAAPDPQAGDAAPAAKSRTDDAASEGSDKTASAGEEGSGPDGAKVAGEVPGEDAGEKDDAEEPDEQPEGGLLFGHTPRPGSRAEDLLRVCELALRMAEHLGLRLFDPVLGETFETEDWAYRLTEPFHARGYLATHWVRGDDDRVSWVHTHGMERFGLPDVEAFDVPEHDGSEVVAFLHEAALSWIRDDAPVPSASPRRIDGVRVRVLESTVARKKAKGYDESAWAEHDSPYLSLAPVGDWSEALTGWRPSSVRRPPRLVERLCAITNEILPAVRTRFERDGAAVKVKARFPVATAPEKGSPGYESMWVHVEEWKDGKIRGRLANEPEIRVDLECGAAVDVNPEEVWDVLVVKDGQPYRGVSLRRWLRE